MKINNKFLLFDQTFLKDKWKRREPVVKVKGQGHSSGGGWGPTQAKLGTLLVYNILICILFMHANTK
jgi:hypothetical protein